MHISSHIKLGKMLLDKSSLKHKPLHRAAFLFGSIKPDICASFLISKHTPGKRLDWVISQIKRCAAEEGSLDERSCISAVRIGVICHFLADFFCYPHNEVFGESKAAHYKYEKELYEYIKNPPLHSPIREYPCGDEGIMTDTLLCAHKEYLIGEKGLLEKDASYIIAICSYIFVCIEYAAAQNAAQAVPVPVPATV